MNSRLTSKEAQGSLIKEMITEAEINEEEAGMIVSEHLDAIAAVEKIHDDEKSRQVMALEMRLEERKAMAQQIVRNLDYNITLKEGEIYFYYLLSSVNKKSRKPKCWRL